METVLNHSKVFDNLNSNAIRVIKVQNNTVLIEYNSSNKEYIFELNENNSFEQDLEDILTNKQSVGSFIHKSIRSETLTQINKNDLDGVPVSELV
jgi:hypothetical protein